MGCVSVFRQRCHNEEVEMNMYMARFSTENGLHLLLKLSMSHPDNFLA